MKNIITFLLSCLSLTALIGQAINETRVALVSASATETVLHLSLTGADRQAVVTPQGEALVISIPEGTPLLQEGNPDVPKFATALAIPATGNMEVEILSSEFQDFSDVSVAPSKGNLKRNIDPATVPYTFGTTYEHDAFFPGKLAELKQPFVMRDVRGQALWIYPVQYNPVSKTMRVYTGITVRVHHTGGQGVNELSGATARARSLGFEQLYQNTFLNAQVIDKARSGADPEKMLVITSEALLTELEPLVTWKRQMGIQTEVVTVEEIGSSESSAIYNYAKDYYQNNGNTYLLLVGDENAIQSEMRLSGGTPYTCDNCFGYMEGDDHFVEVFVGRLHASNPEQLRIMVNRNLDYEKTPLVDAAENWCATGMASTSDQGAGIGDDGQADFEQGNEWKSKHLDDGYEKYWEFYDGSHADISPTPGDETADKAGDPVNTQLVSLMNGRGVSIYNYTGHGWEQGLSSGNFNVDAVATLRNTHRYPILISVACCAGNFTNGECLGEAWQRAGDPATGEAWGGIAGFFSSDFQSWAPPMEGQDGMNQYLVDADGITLRPTIGGMLAFGNALMIAAYDQGGEVMADFWNPFAEPTTMPRTKLPQPLLATHQAATFIGTSSLTVYSDVEGALVSLYWQGQTLAVATVEGGVANLSFAALDNVGDIVVTVSQFNYIPYQGAIGVTASGTAFVVSQGVVLDDVAGNNNQKADFGENVKLNVTLANVGVLTANATSATLSTNDDGVIITDNTELFGDLDPSAALEKVAAFAFTVNDDVADGQKVNFKLHIAFNGTESFDALIPVTLQAPKLSVTQFIIDDVSGNGNGRLESGETAIVTITNLNSGHSPSPNAAGILSSDSPWLTVSSTMVLGNIAVNGSVNAVFSVKVADDAPKVVPANFHYQLAAGNYGQEKDYGPFIINQILETFETQNFGSFPWVMAGNKPWQITSAAPYSGAYCSRSGNIGQNQKSVMELTVNVSTDGLISFARKVSCEVEFDFLRFSIDDEEVERWSGIQTWEEVSYPVTAGFHKFTWSYEKDGVGTTGQDRAWVDEISLPPHEIVVGTGTPDATAFRIAISPNPTTGIALLSVELPSEQAAGIEIFDLAGRSVQALPVLTRGVAGAFTQTLDLGGLPQGVYLVRVQTASGTRAEKVVKQ
ncbi:MAG: T9SS type A sorting domain-containing protein [Lewinellaceae bacterium]|nr:T9SS type A sorting domain-containing protein [Lewinellaceae bacterium]